MSGPSPPVTARAHRNVRGRPPPGSFCSAASAPRPLPLPLPLPFSGTCTSLCGDAGGASSPSTSNMLLDATSILRSRRLLRACPESARGGGPLGVRISAATRALQRAAPVARMSRSVHIQHQAAPRRRPNARRASQAVPAGSHARPPPAPPRRAAPLTLLSPRHDGEGVAVPGAARLYGPRPKRQGPFHPCGSVRQQAWPRVWFVHALSRRARSPPRWRPPPSPCASRRASPPRPGTRAALAASRAPRVGRASPLMNAPRADLRAPRRCTARLPKRVTRGRPRGARSLCCAR